MIHEFVDFVQHLQTITVAVSSLIECTLPGEYAARKQLHLEEMEKLAR